MPLHDRPRARREFGLFSPVFVLNLGTSGCSFHSESPAALALPPGPGAAQCHPPPPAVPPQTWPVPVTLPLLHMPRAGILPPSDSYGAKIGVSVIIRGITWTNAAARGVQRGLSTELIPTVSWYFGIKHQGEKSFQQDGRHVHPLASPGAKWRPAHTAGQKQDNHWGLLIVIGRQM